MKDRRYGHLSALSWRGATAPAPLLSRQLEISVHLPAKCNRSGGTREEKVAMSASGVKIGGGRGSRSPPRQAT